MKPTILVIEDDPTIAIIIRAWMEKHTPGDGSPVEVQQAMTLAAGFASAPQATVIILDLGLPDSIDPVATARQIPLLRQYAPVIVLTSYQDADRPAESELLESCVKEYGADVCIFKAMLDKSGMEWFMLMLQAAMCRRVYEKQSRDGLYMPARRQYKRGWDQPELPLQS